MIDELRQKALELVEEAYREGFGDGESQAARYEHGRCSMDVNLCWFNSVSKQERSEI